MDVILLEDVKTLGKKGQIVKINDGYARNYVLPKKLGIEANRLPGQAGGSESASSTRNSSPGWIFSLRFRYFSISKVFLGS